MTDLAICAHLTTELRDKPPHTGEFCTDCGAWIRWVSKAKTGTPKRSVASRAGIKPRTRARILDRFGHTCMACGAAPPDVLLQVDHIIPVSVAKRHELYDEVIEDDLNLAPYCEECNLGKGAEVFTARSVRIMHRCVTIAMKERDA